MDDEQELRGPSDYLERKTEEVKRLRDIEHRLELAQKSRLLTPLQYYASDVRFLLELLKGD